MSEVLPSWAISQKVSTPLSLYLDGDTPELVSWLIRLLVLTRPTDERVNAAKFLKGRVDLSKLDSGRNQGNDTAGDLGSDQEGGSGDKEEGNQPMEKLPAPKKRKVGNRRR